MKLSLEKELNNWIDNLSNIKNLSQNSIISYKNDVLKFLDFLSKVDIFMSYVEYISF